MAKPVTRISAERPSTRSLKRILAGYLLLGDERHQLGHVDILVELGLYAQQRSDPRNDPPGERCRHPSRGLEAVRGFARFGIVEHHKHDIARMIHRKSAGKDSDV